MERDRKALAAVVRAFRVCAVALLAAMIGTGAWTACSTPDGTSSARAADVDPGPTFGVEVTVAIKGRGRVVSQPAAIDCPHDCFARIVLADPKLDGADLGLQLTAEATKGSYFAGWSYDLIKVGARGRGPSQCNPMMRTTSAPPVVANDPRVALHYGETTGTPPLGLETECADFLNVPVAYALTATFSDTDSGIPSARDAGIQQLFEPPGEGVVGREIGVAGGKVYWRFDDPSVSNLSGMAVGLSSGGGDAGRSRLAVDPRNAGEALGSFNVDQNALFQNMRGELKSIPAGSDFPVLLYNGFGPATCPWVASNGRFGYCRYSNGSQTNLYAWPVAGGAFNAGYLLPAGRMVAVDSDRAYFASEADGGVSIQSAPLPEAGGGGGLPPITTLATGQTAPRGLVVGPTNLFWIDSQGGTSVTRSLPKGGGDPKPGVVATNVRFIVPDPTSPTIYWVGLPSQQNAQSAILRASTFSGSVTALVANLPSLGGLAVDATHVYWTQTDGRVFRARKP